MELQDDEVVVKKEELQSWLEKMKELNQLKVDLEKDIGWVATAIDNVMNNSNIWKLVPKIMTGKVSMKQLGLDDERLEALSAKYAPVTHEQIKSKNKKA